MARGRAGRTSRTSRTSTDRVTGARTGLGLRLSLSTRRAAVLALVVCGLALTLAVPLRTYVGQRQQLAETVAQREELRNQVADLQQQRLRLDDPAYVQSQARERLRYVRPGETPYQVQLPGDAERAEAAENPVSPPSTDWYAALWASVNQPAGAPR
ncbi:septum formation initiator family protein [Rhodococcus sp. X156]|uniref:FtsB family cell division protein n=1 Tax=Rhodococcus sp. X156 TaxID=2499145 RepID=UPI000FDC7434|nr:septum formation initiator family protein [Rhodococcus sp. X156]